MFQRELAEWLQEPTGQPAKPSRPGRANPTAALRNTVAEAFHSALSRFSKKS